MLFSYAVRAVYVESCTMFTRGGVYRVVKGAMGGGLAKLSVSALMFDYILTGPISAVSAGQYIVGLFVDMLNLALHHFGHPPIDPTGQEVKHLINSAVTVLIAIFITIYFWRTQHRRHPRIQRQGPAHHAAHHRHGRAHHRAGAFPPSSSATWRSMPRPSIRSSRIPASAAMNPPRAGSNTSPASLGALGILIAFGHTLLAMSGEESLAQVNREIEAPKLKNLLRAGFVIFLYSMLLTSLISFFAVIIIPDGKRVMTMVVANGSSGRRPGRRLRRGRLPPRARCGARPHDWGYRLARCTDDKGEETRQDRSNRAPDARHHVQRDDGGYRDNLINGLVQYLAGPDWAQNHHGMFRRDRRLFHPRRRRQHQHGRIQRRPEPPGRRRRPHPVVPASPKRFGTTHRLINLIAILQVITIVASWGDVDTLGEAYAFGVIWSFVFMTMAMVVLRFKDRTPRQYEVPLNIRKQTRQGQIDSADRHFRGLPDPAQHRADQSPHQETATIWGVGFHRRSCWCSSSSSESPIAATAESTSIWSNSTNAPATGFRSKPSA
jgi:hypothetical protein